MNLGERLLELRKSKHLSQEEVAEKLNVTRQTVSKWETDQSTPDFDKIIPLCELYGITSDELLRGTKPEEKGQPTRSVNDANNIKRAKGIGISILLYFAAVIWIIIAIPVFKMNPIVATAIFLVIIAIATCYIIYTNMVYGKEKTEKEKKKNQLYKRIDSILSLIVLIIYLLISFITFAWHITWLIWIVYALISEIIKLILSLKGEYDEEE